MSYLKTAGYTLLFLLLIIIVMALPGRMASHTWGISLYFGLCLFVPWLAFSIFLAAFHNSAWTRKHFSIPLGTQGIVTIFLLWSTNQARHFNRHLRHVPYEPRFTIYAILVVAVLFWTHAMTIIYKKKNLFYLWPAAVSIMAILLFCLIGNRITLGRLWYP